MKMIMVDIGWKRVDAGWEDGVLDIRRGRWLEGSKAPGRILVYIECISWIHHIWLIPD